MSAGRQRPALDTSARHASGRLARGVLVYIVGTILLFAAAAGFIGAAISGQPVAAHAGFAVGGVVLLVVAGWVLRRGWHLFNDPWHDYSSRGAP